MLEERDQQKLLEWHERLNGLVCSKKSRKCITWVRTKQVAEFNRRETIRRESQMYFGFAGKGEGFDGYVDRVEEILRSVIDNELKLIIITGYVLGGLIGMVTFGISRLIGL